MSKRWRKKTPLYGGIPRCEWYFSYLHPSTRRFMEDMPDETWREWHDHRYNRLWFRLSPGIDNTLVPPLDWWERECFNAMLHPNKDTGDYAWRQYTCAGADNEFVPRYPMGQLRELPDIMRVFVGRYRYAIERYPEQEFVKFAERFELLRLRAEGQQVVIDPPPDHMESKILSWMLPPA
jgi:hypothetical protein